MAGGILHHLPERGLPLLEISQSFLAFSFLQLALAALQKEASHLDLRSCFMRAREHGNVPFEAWDGAGHDIHHGVAREHREDRGGDARPRVRVARHFARGCTPSGAGLRPAPVDWPSDPVLNIYLFCAILPGKD